MKVVVLGCAAVAMTVRPSDSSGASSPLCRDTSRRFLPCRFFLFILFLPSPRLSLSVFLSISLVFWFLCFGCSSLSLDRFLSPFAAVLSFLSFFFPLSGLLHSDGIYRAGGAGTTLPRPIAAHGARSRRSTLSQHRLRRPMGTSLAGHDLSVFSS